jgi:hypothetical protein
MNAVTLTRPTRYGNDHASYYVNETATLVTRGGRFAFVMYSDRTCDGVHDAEGTFIGGAVSDWTPVADQSAAGEIVAAWIADGWELHYAG